jgi:hypothetical protein
MSLRSREQADHCRESKREHQQHAYTHCIAMSRLSLFRELEEKINRQNKQEQNHERDNRHNRPLDPRPRVVDLVALVGLLLGLFRAENPLLTISTRSLQSAESTHLDEITIEPPQCRFNGCVQPGMFSSRPK